MNPIEHKVTIYDGIWQGCTWYVDVNQLTLNEVISHMQKWFELQEPHINWCANNVLLRGGRSVPSKKTLIHKLQFKKSKYDPHRPLVIFEERWKPAYHVERYWELGLLENNKITPLWCDKNGNLKKIDFSYPQKGLLVNFENAQHPWAFQDHDGVYSYI